MKFFKLLLLLLLSVSSVTAQDLMNERIRKIAGKKRSVYFKRGIFYNSSTKIASKLKAIRHGYQSRNGFERLVFDFETKSIPKVYGYMSGNEKKIFIDLFNTSLGNGIGSFGNSKFVEKVEFYPVGDESLSAEVVLKGNHTVDVFYLSKPGRLVIDIKK